LWEQCANLATTLENIISKKASDSTPYEDMQNSQPHWLHKLITFGEIAIVHDGAHAKIRAKLQDKCLAVMFVGYPVNHAGEVCQFLNLKTKKLISSRSAIFLHNNYAEYYSLAKDALSRIPEDSTNLDNGLTDEESPESEPFQNLVEDLPKEQMENPEEEDIEEVGHPDNISGRGLHEQKIVHLFVQTDKAKIHIEDDN
jgi:hypothetical protein